MTNPTVVLPYVAEMAQHFRQMQNNLRDVRDALRWHGWHERSDPDCMERRAYAKVEGLLGEFETPTLDRLRSETP